MRHTETCCLFPLLALSDDKSVCNLKRKLKTKTIMFVFSTMVPAFLRQILYDCCVRWRKNSLCVMSMLSRKLTFCSCGFKRSVVIGVTAFLACVLRFFFFPSVLVTPRSRPLDCCFISHMRVNKCEAFNPQNRGFPSEKGEMAHGKQEMVFGNYCFPAGETS